MMQRIIFRYRQIPRFIDETLKLCLYHPTFIADLDTAVDLRWTEGKRKIGDREEPVLLPADRQTYITVYPNPIVPTDQEIALYPHVFPQKKPFTVTVSTGNYQSDRILATDDINQVIRLLEARLPKSL